MLGRERRRSGMRMGRVVVGAEPKVMRESLERATGVGV